MKINLNNVGKRFNHEWVFRAFTYEFISGSSYAITGPNGSGKSTLLQVIAGSTIYNEGNIEFNNEGSSIPSTDIFKYISFAAPYLELIEEMTLTEFLKLHHDLKGWADGISTQAIIELLGLGQSADKQIRYFSSGMKQRLKLAQAIFSKVPVILLDEPITNLDTDGVELYYSLVRDYCKEKLLIISSNDKNEYEFCNTVIDIRNYRA